MSTATSRTLISRSQSVSQTLQATLQNLAVKEFLAEFIGTFILIAVGDAAVAAYLLKSKPSAIDTFAVNFCFGIGAFIGISASMNISGGHINPAVTVAFAAFKKFPWRKVWYYLLAQYLGGFAAAAVVYITYAEAIASFDEGHRSAFGNENSTGGIFATYPAPYATIFGVFIDQVIGTSILIIAVMAITDEKNIKTPKGIQPLAIGFMIAGVCTAYCLNAGAIFNPARDVPPRILTAVAGWGLEPFKPLGGHYWWVAGIVGPHIGAMVGIIIYTITIDHQSLCIETRSVVPKENVEAEHHAEKNGSAKVKETSMNGEKHQSITMP